ncbi:uncharacterized protein LOC133197456 [Saccostrea echinata]|uniref:uncharacterized protein LOC133175451 n=1 Tax=Saccostrea echinata TaxID=191078 RepID=UPI002A8101D1|nr:uncharacterized protein LOC133175451 [Saccostrea echinata]XP_061189495.1 uncharacterized protein LOC133197456 [Saccostrea echinata]
MGDSSKASGSRLPSPFSPPSEPRIRKRRGSSKSSGAYESDESYSSRPKLGRYGGDHVSNWNTFQLESFGIFYDVKATELSELYKSALEKMYSWAVGNTAFLTKLLQIKEVLIESTKKCMHSLDVDEEFEMENLRLPGIIEETEKCMQAMAKIKEEMSLKFGSAASSDNLSRDLYSIWFTGISEYVQYYSDLIKELNSEGRGGVEGQFSQLLTFFSKIFLMNPTRGDASQKVQMTLNGIETTSVPDLRYSMQGDLSVGNIASLVTVAVGEVKTWLPVAYGEKTTTDFNITKWKFRNQSVERLLGQHGGELLVETKKSVIADTNLGIICVKTMIIFTRLDWEKGHLVCLKNGTKVDDKRSNIHYSKPYNFLVRKEREEILDTMFNLGLLCRVRSLLTYQE